jgi:hypothetical protein
MVPISPESRVLVPNSGASRLDSARTCVSFRSAGALKHTGRSLVDFLRQNDLEALVSGEP